MTNTCDCSRACGDAFACTECARTAGHNLAQIAQLADCLDGKRARQRTSWNVTNLDTSRRGTGWRTDSGQRFTIPRAHQPFAPSAALAYDSRVTATQDRVKNALVGMARLVIEADRSIAWPADNSHAIALWLMPYVIRKARFQEWASEMFTEVHGIREELLALLDNPPPTIYLGRCDAEIDGTPCPESLYVERDHVPEVALCPKCGTGHNVKDRRELLLAGVDDYLGTAREISALLRQMEGGRVSTKAIAGYVRRGRLESAGDRVEFRANGATAKVPVYRIGAVRELVAKLDDERRERRALRKVNTPRGA